MKIYLLPLTSLLLLLPGAYVVADEADDGIIGGMRLGMTESDVNEQYPEGKMSMDGSAVIVEGRYGDFRRGDETFEKGLTMFKIRPNETGSKESCQSFYDTFKPKMTGHFGDPQSESSNDQSGVSASQAAWEGPGLFIRLEAVWYEEQATCSAELFVRPTDIEPL